MNNETFSNEPEEVTFAPMSRPLPPLVEADAAFAKKIKNIPDKMAFKIGEAADIVGVKAYVLRYWETEFDALKPKKAKNNQRMYTRRNVELAMMIKKLLHEDRFSIEGARTALSKMKKETKKAKALHGTVTQLEELRGKAYDLVMDIRRAKQLFS